MFRYERKDMSAPPLLEHQVNVLFQYLDKVFDGIKTHMSTPEFFGALSYRGRRMFFRVHMFLLNFSLDLRFGTRRDPRSNHVEFLDPELVLTQIVEDEPFRKGRITLFFRNFLSFEGLTRVREERETITQGEFTLVLEAESDDRKMLLLDQLLCWVPPFKKSSCAEVRIRTNRDPRNPNGSKEPGRIHDDRQAKFIMQLDKWTKPSSLRPPLSVESTGHVIEISDGRIEDKRTKRTVDAKRDERTKRRRTEDDEHMEDERTERTVDAERDDGRKRRRPEDDMEERIPSGTLTEAFENRVPEVKEEVFNPDWDPSDVEAPETPSPISVDSS